MSKRLEVKEVRTVTKSKTWISCAAIVLAITSGCSANRLYPTNRPKELVGKSLAVYGTTIEGGKDPDALWSWHAEVTNKARQKGIAALGAGVSSNERRLMDQTNLTNLNVDSDWDFISKEEKLRRLNTRLNEAMQEKAHPQLLVHVLRSSREDSQNPVFEVEVKNKKYAGTNWWISWSDLKFCKVVDPKITNINQVGDY